MTSGGPISTDNTRAEFHCTIISIAESPRDPNVIWAGTDDGNVQVTRDGGKTWTNVAPNITGAPKFSWVSSISASNGRRRHGLHLTIDQHRLDDFAPYVFVTTDYGSPWRRISDGLRGYVHVVLEDPKAAEPDLRGHRARHLGVIRPRRHAGRICGSACRRWRWSTEVHPRDNDLVIATHARGFYILDDVTPLQEMASAARSFSSASPAASAAPILFKPMPAVRYTPASDTSVLGNRVWVARNQPYGAIINY